jgi:CheY-like chemotaxis protein
MNACDPSANEQRRVLVVEDEMLVAMLLTDTLDELGYAVVGPCARLRDALEKVENETFDAALLDVNLNGENVYSLAETLKQRGIPFAFATGYAERDLPPPWNTALTIMKPFRRDDLSALLDSLFASQTPHPKRQER